MQEEYEEIYEDIKETLSKYGKVVKLEIPQPNSDETECPGMGHAFVEYSAVSSAQLARRVGSCNSRKCPRNSTMAVALRLATTMKASLLNRITI